MGEQAYVTYGSAKCGIDGASLDITGCRFSVAPMSDNFVEILTNAFTQVNTSKVWSATDALSSVYRGRACHVVDAVRAFFVAAENPTTHTTMEATFSKGCPGDSDADVYLAEDDTLVNDKFAAKHFPVIAKIALYPMGEPDYMPYIAAVVNRAIDLGIYDKSTHYNTYLAGDVQDLFDYVQWVCDYCGEQIHHYIFELTVSVHSPSLEA